MSQINLLPWREDARVEGKKQFTQLMVIGVASAAGLVFAGNMLMTAKIEAQQSRNDYINGKLAKLDSRIQQIKKLEDQKRLMLDRMRVIEQLQSSRPASVHLLEALARTMPNGLFVEEMKQDGRSVHLTGKANSSVTVSNYMNRIDASKWMNDSQLTFIEKQPDHTGLRSFELSLKQVLKQALAEPEGKTKK